MRKCRLINFSTDFRRYKGDPYMVAHLTFEIIFLGIWRYTKTIEYHVTMFSNHRDYIDNWRQMIDNKSLVKYSIIKDNKIF